MESYLLKAPATDMDRWKADAKSRGRSFAEHIRIRLDGPEPPKRPVRLVVPPLSSFKPDPKPGRRK